MVPANLFLRQAGQACVCIAAQRRASTSDAILRAATISYEPEFLIHIRACRSIANRRSVSLTWRRRPERGVIGVGCKRKVAVEARRKYDSLNGLTPAPPMDLLLT